MSILGQSQRLGVAALLLAISSLLSRLMGLIRDKVISWQFGAGQEADLYFAAFVVPDCINYLLAGGFMSITIMPLLAKAFAEDEAKAWSFFSCVLSWMALSSIFFTGLGFIFAEDLAKIVAPGFQPPQLARLAFFMRLILPAQVFFLCGACFTALLFLRRQFRVPALSPLIYNGSIILLGLLLPALAAIFSQASFAEMSQKFGMSGYCLGVSLGAFLGAFLLPWFTAKQTALHFRPTFSHPLLKRFLCLALPLMLGQTIIMLDEQFLRIFGSLLSEGSVSLLNYARRIAQVPLALVGQAAAVASYPFLVALLAKKQWLEFQRTLNQALLTGLTLIIPCVAFLLANSHSILTLIFQGGRFSSTETQACVPLLEIMLLAIPFTMLYMILVRGFYAREDTLTPALSGTLMTVLVLPIYICYASKTSAQALAATSSISLSLYVVFLFLIWIKRHGQEVVHNLGRRLLMCLSLSLPAALVARLSENMLGQILAHYLPPVLLALISLGICASVFLLLFLPLALYFLPEYTTQGAKIFARISPKLSACLQKRLQNMQN